MKRKTIVMRPKVLVASAKDEQTAEVARAVLVGSPSAAVIRDAWLDERVKKLDGEMQSMISAKQISDVATRLVEYLEQTTEEPIIAFDWNRVPDGAIYFQITWRCGQCGQKYSSLFLPSCIPKSVAFEFLCNDFRAALKAIMRNRLLEVSQHALVTRASTEGN